ncbi:DMT family transporter [Streptomyces sp. HNM0575]|uniref:DMT family transporter n=1 Tax=Streptomyces sp. HNM0575 TaxID=2716338 RepID=UPI00145FB031|nr:DMT family transporter [Streptomyces sp. HNM0575]NLU75370.1 DMT family transporter [Streptomyces sp. HNM0575]
MLVLSVVLALFGALANAAASVLQRRAAATERVAPSGRRFSWLTHLLHRPVWMWGSAMLIFSGIFQAGALATGPLAVVQPVMATELLFTLVVGSVFFHRRPDARAWRAFLTMVTGLAVFLVLIDPSVGTTRVPVGRWLAAGAVLLTIVILLIVLATRLPSSPRATVLGAATSFGFSATAALMKDAVARLSDGLVALFTAWQTYAVGVVGLGSFLLLQMALRAGTLVASQPALTLGDSLMSLVLGAVLFDEQLRLGILVVPELGALALVGAGSLQLARTPEVSGDEQGEVW